MANEESLFLFCGRRTDRIKALYWTGDGHILLYKRLSNGRFQWPRSEAELKLLDPQSFRCLTEGLRIEQITAIRKGKPKDLNHNIVRNTARTRNCPFWRSIMFICLIT